MADVDPELMALRAEYEQVVGKPAMSRNKNNKDMLRKKIEMVKNPKEKKPRGRPPTGSVLAKPSPPAAEPATEDSPDILLSPDKIPSQESEEAEDEDTIDPKQFSAIMYQMSRDVWWRGMFISLPPFAQTALQMLGAPDNVFHADSWDDENLDDNGNLNRWGDWFFEQPVWEDLTEEKRSAARLLGFDQEKWDYDEDDY